MTFQYYFFSRINKYYLFIIVKYYQDYLQKYDQLGQNSQKWKVFAAAKKLSDKYTEYNIIYKKILLC